ncbi:MAG: class I SAM-dependent methyltransferase [Desulfobacterium sp.]|nr:class I SAM-dependent methyltransferase [Desulfobacteraceae bacterium]MBA3035689.1 class I SAM-dependent methyltransferase [Desulfobacterium sp.]MBU3948105.1 class I SAM-dependent methyltransferase [Pseudomonadota bacterium]
MEELKLKKKGVKKMPLTDKDIQVLKKKYTWPQMQPEFSPVEWILDGGGKELVVNRICKDKPFLIIEIGCFLGSSIKKWFAVSSNVYIIAIDPWEGDWWVDYARMHGRHSLTAQFARENGPYLTFLSSLWGYKERLFPVRGASPEKLYELAKLGIQPDLIYFDSDKTGMDIEIAHQLFPDAILTGDDWTWGIEQGYPIREAVRIFSKDHGYQIVANRATWVLAQTPLKLSEKIYNMLSFARDFNRALRRFVK